MTLISERYIRPLLYALVTQTVLLFLAVCGDPPELFMPAVTFPSVGFWIGVIMIIIRRPDPTKGDLAFISRGLLWTVLLGGCIGVCYWCVFRGAMG